MSARTSAAHLGDMTEQTAATDNDTLTVRLAIPVRDAQFAVEHLRFLADRDTPTEADHAAANLTARWLADQVETALAAAVERGRTFRFGDCRCTNAERAGQKTLVEHYAEIHRVVVHDA